MNNNQNRKRLAAMMMATSFLLSSCSGGTSSDYTRARSLFSEGRYDEARELFQSMGEYENSRKYIAYIDAWNAGKNGDYESAYLGFRALAGFLDSSEEAADFSQQAQKDAYNSALSHFRRGEYDEAIQSLNGIEGYEDASMYLEYAEAMVSARDGKLDSAIDSFIGLGDFRDSAFQAEKWSAKQKETEYKKGCQLIEAGAFADAVSVFTSLGDYSDAKRYLLYAQARVDLDNGNYEAAEKSFTELGLFLDSPSMIALAESQKKDALVRSAQAAVEKGSYQEAADLLRSADLSGNEEAEKLFVYADAMSLSMKGQADAASEKLAGLGDYRDSAEQLEKLQTSRNAKIYDEAVALFQDGKTDEAEALFATISDYAPAKNYITYLSALKHEAAGAYDEAAASLRSIPDFLDAGAKAGEDWEKYCSEAYARACEMFENGSYKDAESVFSDIADYGASSDYLAYIQAEQMGRSGSFAEASNAFAELGDFSDSTSRAEVYQLLGNQSVYDEAVSLFQAGKTAEALNAFEKADHYGDSDLYVRYIQAVQMLDEGKVTEAAAALNKLGKFLDSESLAASADLALKQTAYQEGTGFFESGSLEEAKACFLRAGNYQDAEKYAQYLSARILENAGSNDEAEAIFTSVSGFLDSSERAQALHAVHVDQTYLRACELTQLGRLDEAEAAFSGISDHADAAKYLQYISARKTEESDADAAGAVYAQLGNFLDCTERAAAIQESRLHADYLDAVRLTTLGSFEEAKTAFEALEGYQDSSDYVTYVSARLAEQNGAMKEAETLYASLSRAFLDSAQRIEAIDADAVEDLYANAVLTLDQGNLKEARELFQTIYPFEDCAKYLQYIQAEMYAQDGKYNAAAEIFASLGEFEDSVSRGKQCLNALYTLDVDKAESLLQKGRLAEAQLVLLPYEDEAALQLSSYIHALQLMEEGHYDEARQAFDALNGYRESIAYADECLKAMNSTTYQQAVTLFETDSYAEARAVFDQLGDYADAPSYLSYIDAASLCDAGDFAGAISLFQSLGDFRDSREQLETIAGTQTQSVYSCGKTALEQGRLHDAQACFSVIADYSDSRQYLDYIQARMTEMQGRYGDAAQMYQALGNDVLDSSERADECLKKESNEQLLQASALMERGAWQEALEVLNQVDIDVQDEIAYCNAGLLMQSGQYEDARNAYRAISDVRSSQSLADACDTAIDNQSYTEGMTALENGNLEAARTAFEKAGADYLDTESYLDYITAREAEQEERFAEAESLYMLCDGFLDSSTRAISCHTAAQRVKYLEAAVLLGQGRLKAARTIYESLDHYLQTDDYLTYIEGRRLENEENHAGAAEAFSGLGVFLDSDIRAARNLDKVHTASYLKAQRFYQLGLLEASRDLFASLGDYQDASQYNAYLTEVLTYLDGNHLEKAEKFAAMGDFEQAPEYADYLRALQLEEDGKYADAAEIYRAHTAFLDSSERYLSMPSRIMENDLKAASDYLAQGNKDEAENIYQSLLSHWGTDSESPETRIASQASAAVEQGDLDTARTLYALLINHGDQNAVSGLMSAAQGQYDAGNYTVALDLLSALHGENETAAALQDACHYQLAQSAEREHDLQLAYSEYSKMHDASGKTEQLEQAYVDAMNLLIDGSYLQAKDAFSALHNLLDSEERAKEAGYRAAGMLEEQGQADQASALFAELGDYRDSASRVTEPYHKLALQLMEKEAWQDAETAFEKAGESESGHLLIQKTQYELAQAMLDVQDYEKASTLFALAGDYLDSAQRVQTVLISRGDKLLEDGDFKAAIAAYEKAYPTEEAWQRIQKAHYTWAVSLEASGDRSAASEQFALAGTYEDAQARIREPFDLHGDALASQGAYGEAVDAYLEAGINEKTTQKIHAMLDGLKERHLYDTAMEAADHIEPEESAADCKADIMLHKAEYLLSEQKWEEASDAFALSSMPERSEEPFEVYASNLIEAGRFDDALAVYDTMGDTKHARDLIHSARIRQANDLTALGSYDDAYRILLSIGEPDLALNVYLLEGDALLEKGYFDAAVAAYTKAGDTRAVTDRIARCRYAQGKQLLEKKQYRDAALAFEAAGAYEDAESQKKDAFTLAAVEQINSENYAEAADLYTALGDAKMAKAAYYANAQQLLTLGKWEEASAAFIRAGDYEDAATRITEPYMTAGNQLAVQGLYDEAIAMYAKAGEAAHEKILALHYQRALQYEAEGKPELASSEFVAAGEYLDASLRVSGTFMDSGDAFLKVGRFSDAINAFSRAGSAAAEKLAEAHYLYAESCAARGEWSEAEKQYLAAGEYENAGERLHEMYLAAGKALAAQGNLKESISMYMKSGLDSEETVKELQYQQAVDALAHGEWDKAHDAFAAAGNYRDAAERVLEPYMTAGKTLSAQGKYDEAIAMYLKAGDRGAEEIQKAHYQHAVDALADEAWETAEKEFNAAGDYLDAKQRVVEPYLTAGDLLLSEGKYEEAIHMFARAGESGSERISLVHYMHAEALLAEQKWDEANREFLLAGDRDDQASRVNEPYITAGDHLLASGHYDEAIAMYAKAGEAGNASIHKAYYVKAENLMDEHAWEQASAAFAAAGDYKDAPSRVNEPFFTGGDLLLKAQQWDEAITEYAKAGVAGTERIQLAYYAKAEALLNEQEWEKAAASFLEAGNVLDAPSRVCEPYITSGNQLLSSLAFDEAIAMYAKAGTQGAELIQKAYYQKAEMLLSGQKWAESSAAFAAAGDYQDAASRIYEPFLKAGDLLLESQKFAEAIDMYSQAGNAGKEKIQHAYYTKAEKLLWSLSWEEASAAFAAAGEYQDAAQRVSEPFMKAGDLFLTSKAWDNALSMYAKAGDTGREAIQKTHYLHAEYLLNAHEWSLASAEFAAAGNYMDSASRIKEPFMTAGDIALAGGNYTQAISMYAEAGSTGDTKRKGTYYAYAEALMAGESWDEASHAFQMAEDYLDAQKRQSEPYEKAALKAIEAGDYALASSFYQKAGQEDAARKCTYTLAEHLLSAKDWDAASAAFAACGDYLDAKQRIAEPYLIAGDTFLAENRYNEAIRMYEKAGDAGAVSIQNAYYVEAEALLLSKQWDEANRLFLKAGDYRDASVRAYAAFKEEGDLLLNEGKTAEAFEAYAKAGETGQSWIHAVHYNWAQEALQAGNWEESSREFQLAENYLDAQSRVYEPYYVHGKQLLEQKAYLSAAEAFVKAEDFPNAEMHAKEAWYNYAQDLLDEQEYGKAETYFSKASGYMNADEMSHESIYLLGSAYLEQSDFEKAYDAFRTIRGYRDVDDMLQTWRLRQVAQGRTGKRSKYTVGRCIGLGKYMQSAGCDQSETVEWMIICRDDNRVLLTTRYILTASAFSANQSGDYMSSKVRSYLNGPFLQECFDGKLLQSLIPQENLEGDKVFLLSRDECDDYLLNGKWQYKNRAAAKSWARAQGVAVTGSHHVGNYWLRDLSSSESGALAVRQDGSYSVIAANDATVGIRPAVWIDLDVLYPQ